MIDSQKFWHEISVANQVKPSKTESKLVSLECCDK